MSWLLSGLTCGAVGIVMALAPSSIASNLLTRLKMLIAALLSISVGAWFSTYAFQGLDARRDERQSAKLRSRRDR